MACTGLCQPHNAGLGPLLLAYEQKQAELNAAQLQPGVDENSVWSSQPHVAAAAAAQQI